MRYHVKGGIWKNTEDEILKAAVMKYGLNQWSRISSLLVRKSAKQCKERWYEWLDPQIKKTEWTKDEEEKLLNLAKMFPCQWRTIAPIVGRTAFQCLEHYEKLLDKAQGRDIEDENDPRKLRPGEIDPNPETKPARPDPIDMDEDEKEMLNEARARLANTRGKKAKRKAREKQLEEARRLAALQKKRELKSAGIDVVLRLPRKKKKEMNYNIDVPFQRKVPEGSWSDNLEQTPEVNKFKGAISLQFLENRNRDEEEEKFRKIDAKRMKNLKQKDLPDAIDLMNKMNDPSYVIQRNKLVLPEPQVNDKDLEGISKLATGRIEDTLGDNTIPEINATKVLIGDYTQSVKREIEQHSNLRTPRMEDHILKEAKIAASLRESQTPLAGGENARSDLTNYINHSLTDNRKGNHSQNFKTPAVSKTKLTNTKSKTIETPLRDEMKINFEEEGINTWEKEVDQSTLSSTLTPKMRINSMLTSLPKPKNNYEIDLLDEYSDNLLRLKNQVEEEAKQNVIEKDSEDVEKSERELKLSKEKEEMLKQSAVIRRNLPRPIDIPKMNIEDPTKSLIFEQMIQMITNDAINYPFKESQIRLKEDYVNNEEEFSLEEKSEIEEIITKEQVKLNLDEFIRLRREMRKNVFLTKNDSNVEYSYYNEDNFDKFKSLQENFLSKKTIRSKEEKLQTKLNEKANILLGGYLKKMSEFMTKYNNMIYSIGENQRKILIYSGLQKEEDSEIQNRQCDLERNLIRLKERENILQESYKNLKEKLDSL